MNWTDIGILIPIEYLETAEAIAQLAVPYGIYIEDYSDMLELVPEIAHIDIIDEDLLKKDRTKGIIHLYISPDQSPAEAISFLTHRLTMENVPFEVQENKVKEEDWATAWKEFYHPTEIGKKVVIVPSWETYDNKDGRKVITLDPGMAFGTGTHHTTRLCTEMLEEVINEGDRVLDLGTGSGILSIVSLKLGAKEAVGVDIDAVAVRTAAENAAQNGFTEPKFKVFAGDLVTDKTLSAKVGKEYDVIAANIVADIIIALAPAIREHLKAGGTLVTSGIILPRKDEVIEALTGVGLKIAECRELEGWCAIKCIG